MSRQDRVGKKQHFIIFHILSVVDLQCCGRVSASNFHVLTRKSGGATSRAFGRIVRFLDVRALVFCGLRIIRRKWFVFFSHTLHNKLHLPTRVQKRIHKHERQKTPFFNFKKRKNIRNGLTETNRISQTKNEKVRSAYICTYQDTYHMPNESQLKPEPRRQHTVVSTRNGQDETTMSKSKSKIKSNKSTSRTQERRQHARGRIL